MTAAVHVFVQNRVEGGDPYTCDECGEHRDEGVHDPINVEKSERIEAPAEDDWRCICGNFVGGAGFYPCLTDGTYVEPTIDGPWDGKLVRCDQCGRIMDQSTWDGSTVAVVGQWEES